MLTPDDILSQPTVSEPWDHVVGFLDENITQSLLDEFHSVDWNLAEVDSDHHIRFYNIHKHGITGENSFITRLMDSEFHARVFESLGVEHAHGYDFTLLFDECGPDSYNASHNDVNRFSDVITLQYYLQLDDNDRCIQLDGQPSGITQGGAVLFKSSIKTTHSFAAGNGVRYSLRLRLRTSMIDPYHIHAKNGSDVGVIIDCKDMESDSGVRHIERRLGRITFEQCRRLGMGNIVVFDKMKDLNTSINTLKKAGIKRCVLLFAGAMPGPGTVESVNNYAGFIQGEVLSDLGRVARKYLIINLEKLNEELQFKGDYLGNMLDRIDNVFMLDADVAHLHLEEDNNEFLKGIMFFDRTANPDNSTDPHVAKIILARLNDLYS